MKNIYDFEKNLFELDLMILLNDLNIDNELINS